mmetsp:Transcript_82686/g.145927  ORF Transcript_82686/g.145927 Transcript_82686/m.145927 type:complete len:451 (+) Transcript_82686:425-1777(+)
MDNKFIPQAIEIVKQAIEADNAKDYEKAYTLYKRALEHFMVGIKWNKNPAAREMILKKVEGYMTRAEQIKKLINNGGASPAAEPSASGGGATAKGGGGGTGDAKGDAEQAKMRGALANAIVTDRPNVKWDDVAGLEGAKDALKEAVILPARFPKLFTGKRRPWKGILLYGPPGTGKSYLAKAVATEAASTFFSVSSSDLVSKWQGESERLVRNLFEMAREKKPAIIFIDEIDSLCSSRSSGENDSARRIKTEFLVQMQGVGKTHDGILVLGATNTPWEIDAAMRRRFEKRVYVPLPEAKARATMFKIHLGDTPNDLKDADFGTLGKLSEGFSGSDISVAVREALMEPLRICRTAKFFRKDGAGKYHPVEEYPPCPHCPMALAGQEPPKAPCSHCGAVRMSLYDLNSDELAVPDVTMKNFRTVLETCSTSVAPEELEEFEKWTAEFGEEGA